MKRRVVVPLELRIHSEDPEVITHVKQLQQDYLERLDRAAKQLDTITLRIIWPSLAPDRMCCVLETFGSDCTIRFVVNEIIEFHDVAGDWIRERNGLFLSRDLYDRTLKELHFVDGDTISLNDEQCDKFQLNMF